ncbi:MAG TPA: hypothetical protein V6D21_07955 [Candidatus Obscuribacterales bacterium]
MIVTSKNRKFHSAKTTKSQKTYTNALDQCISYNEKLRLMVLEVLREESGRELASAARFNNHDFDWETHNAQFREDYGTTSLKELMRAAQALYGLNDIDAIRERRAKHRGIRNERIARQNKVIAQNALTLDDGIDDHQIEMD